MIENKIDNFLNAPNDSINFGDISKIKLNQECLIYWGDEAIGKIKRGQKIFSPIAYSLNSEFLSSEKKLLVSSKIQNWLDDEINNLLNPIKDNLDDNLNSDVRAIVFNCFENLGTFPIENFKNFLKDISLEDKLRLSKLGIRIGAKFFYMPNFMKKKQIELNSLLWKTFNETNLNEYLPLPKDGRVSFISETKMPESYWQAIGYICINNFAFRVDVFEKIFYLARKKIKYGPFLESSDLMNPIGCNGEQLSDILNFCGYQDINLYQNKRLYFFKTKNKEIKTNNKKIKTKLKNMKNTKTQKKTDPNSPFAVLEKLL